MGRAYPFTKRTDNGDKCKPGRFYCHCGVDVPETGMKEHLAGHTAPAYAPYVQDASLVVENAPQEEPLDPCSECGQLLPASEMVPLDRVQGRPWQAPNGSGLICQECHQAHKEIQSELKDLSEETPAEPGIPGTGPLPQPAAHCALCGGEFPLADDPSLSCKSCEYRLKAQERISRRADVQRGQTVSQHQPWGGNRCPSPSLKETNHGKEE